jgi:hypothetical protein
LGYLSGGELLYKCVNVERVRPFFLHERKRDEREGSVVFFVFVFLLLDREKRMASYGGLNVLQ